MTRVSLTLSLAAMDVCWVMPWSVLLGLWAGQTAATPLLSLPSVVGLLLLGAVTTQFLGRKAIGQRSTRSGLAVLATVVAAVAVRIDQYPEGGLLDWLPAFIVAIGLLIGQLTTPALAFALALYLWWRGVRLGSQTPSSTDAEGAFRWGVARLVTFGLILGLTTRPSVLPALEGHTTPFVVGFFFIALITLALGRLESLRTRTRRLAINTQWFGVLLLVAAFVVLLALSIGQLLSFDVLIVATRPVFDLLGWVLVLIIYAVVIPLSYVIQWLIYLVLSLFQSGSNPQPPQPLQASDVDNWLSRLLSQQIPPEVLVALKGAGAAALLLLALFVVAHALSRWRPSGVDADTANEERESLWAPERLRSWLQTLIRRLFRRTTVRAQATTDPNSGTDTERVYRGRHPIRELYSRALSLGEQAGVSRAVASTPNEHLPALMRGIEPEAVVADLTAAYNQVRYAEAQPGAAQVSELQQQTDQLHVKGAAD